MSWRRSFIVYQDWRNGLLKSQLALPSYWMTFFLHCSKRAKITTANWIAACLNLILGFPIGTVLGVYSLRKLNTYLKELQDSHND